MYSFNEYRNRYKGIVTYFRSYKLICHDFDKIIIADGTSKCTDISNLLYAIIKCYMNYSIYLIIEF